jgi:hypothetical protein
MDEAGHSTTSADLATYLYPFQNSDLVNVTSLTATASDTALASVSAKGWYINMRSAEKVLSSPLIYTLQYNNTQTGATSQATQIYFNSYMPNAGITSSCAPISGTTSAWTLIMSDGSAGDRDGDGIIDGRYIDNVANGISGSDVVVTINGGLNRYTGTGDGSTGSNNNNGNGNTNNNNANQQCGNMGCAPSQFGKVQRTQWIDKSN